MVHRNSRGFFGDIVVFPGGRVDDIDLSGEPEGAEDAPQRRAALREFAEETGILLSDAGPVAARGLRGAGYYRWLADQGLVAAEEALVLVSRWVTPELAPRRFDTWFYVAACPDPPEVVIDRDELIGHEWVTPETALAKHEDGEWALIQPTLSHLQWLKRWSSVDEALRSASGADGRTLIIPRTVEDGSLLPIHMPAEPA